MLLADEDGEARLLFAELLVFVVVAAILVGYINICMVSIVSNERLY